jgi:hypothetical protein
MTAHALVWGIGGGLDAACWDAFDQAARRLLEGTANYPAAAGTVFDYDLDTERWGLPGFERRLESARLTPCFVTCRGMRRGQHGSPACGPGAM